MDRAFATVGAPDYVWFQYIYYLCESSVRHKVNYMRGASGVLKRGKQKRKQLCKVSVIVVREFNRSDAFWNPSMVCSISVSKPTKTGNSGKVAKFYEGDTDFLLVNQNLGCMRLELLISFGCMSLLVSLGAISTTILGCIAARIECHDIFSHTGRCIWSYVGKMRKLPSMVLATSARCQPGKASFSCNSLFSLWRIISWL
jgi:hypothetical protein